MKTTPETEPRTLQFDNREIVCGLGIGLFVISLAIPAIKHGNDTLGIECFLMGLFCMFGPAHPQAITGNERQLMSLVSHAMHVSAIISIFLAFSRANLDISCKLPPLFFLWPVLRFC